MNTKNILPIVVVVVLLALAGGAYLYLKGMPTASAPESNTGGPAIVGALVGIGTTSITVKSQAGTQMTFELSAKTPVLSQVKEGEVGRVYNQLSIGDVLSVTAQNNDIKTAKEISIIPLSTSTPAGATVVAVTGTIVDITDSSLTIKPASNDPTMAITTTNHTYTITPATQFLTKVLGGQPGKPKSAFVKGATSIVSANSAANSVAQTIVLLP